MNSSAGMINRRPISADALSIPELETDAGVASVQAATLKTGTHGPTSDI